MNATNRPHAVPAAVLVAQFTAAGFTEGPPAGLPASALAVDRRTCRRLKCSRCLQCGLECRPFHNRNGRYRVLAVCPNCGTGDER